MATEQGGAIPATSLLTPITAGAGVGVKNTTYTELISSTARENFRLKVRFKGVTIREGFRVWVATGSASSEVDIFECITWSSTNGSTGDEFEIPVTIASGSRISVTSSSTVSSGVIQVQVELTDSDSTGTSTQNELIGASGAVGTSVDPGGTANTEGSWVEISPSTSFDYDYSILKATSPDNNAMASSDWLVDIAIGAVSSEVAIRSNISFRSDSNEIITRNSTSYEPIASGSRVSVRSQCSITDATDRVLAFTLVGVKIITPSGGGGETAHVFAG